MNPKILIGCPVRNRSWVLPTFLERLAAIKYENKQFMFMENNSKDNTYDILHDFFSHVDGVTLCRFTSHQEENIPSEDRIGYKTNQYAYLADIRNKFMQHVLRLNWGEYLLSIDSDILVPSDSISQLLDIYQSFPRNKRKWIISGAVISNDPKITEITGKSRTNFMNKRNNLYVHPIQYPLEGWHQVDMVGAVHLIPIPLIQYMFDMYGGFYFPDKQGEDLGFAHRAPKETGWYVNMDCRCQHIMTKAMLKK